MHYVSNRMNEKLKIQRTEAATLLPWQKLANAIVEQAVKDYRTAQARVKANPESAVHAKVDVRQL